MEPHNGCDHHSSSINSTSRRVASSSSGSGDARISTNGDNSFHQHTPSQKGSTHANDHTPRHTYPVIIHQSHQRSKQSQQWEKVPRSWSYANPDAYWHVQHPALNECPPSSSSNQYETSQGQSTRGTSNRLVLAELERHDQQHAPMNIVDRWSSESQREGPWDGVGYVRSVENKSGRKNEWWR